MTDMARTRVAIAWPNGGPGVTTFYWTCGIPAGPITPTMVADFHFEIRNAIAANAALWPTDVTFTLQPAVDILDPATGNITGVVTAGTVVPATIGTGASTGQTRGAQACINLLTDDFRRGKRLRGRHFIGPLSSAAVAAGGVIAPATLTALAGQYTAITSGVGPRLAVWHRPELGVPNSGFYADVVSVAVKERPGLLKSRRD